MAHIQPTPIDTIELTVTRTQVGIGFTTINPPTPVTIAVPHVGFVRPGSLNPTSASGTVNNPAIAGTVLGLTSGSQIEVVEDYLTVRALLGF